MKAIDEIVGLADTSYSNNARACYDTREELPISRIFTVGKNRQAIANY